MVVVESQEVSSLLYLKQCLDLCLAHICTKAELISQYSSPGIKDFFCKIVAMGILHVSLILALTLTMTPLLFCRGKKHRRCISISITGGMAWMFQKILKI